MRVRNWIIVFFGICIFAANLSAADLEATRKLLLKGEYAECIQIAGKSIDERVFGEDW